MSDGYDIFDRPLGGNPARMNTYLRLNEPKTIQQLEKESGCPNGRGHIGALVGERKVKSAGRRMGYVIDEEWFDRQPEEKKQQFLASCGLATDPIAVVNRTLPKKTQFWCVNFDFEDCLKHGLKHDLWMMQYQFADDQGNAFQSHKTGAIRNNWQQIKNVKIGDWLVAYLQTNQYFAIGRVRGPRHIKTAIDVSSKVDEYLSAESSHDHKNKFVYYTDAPVLYEDFTDKWRHPGDNLSRYAQRIDVEEWQHVVPAGIEMEGLGKYNRQKPFLAVKQIDEPFFRGIEAQLKKSPSASSKSSASDDFDEVTDDTVAEALEKSHANSQGFQLDSKLRKDLENYAMEAAKRHFLSDGYEVEDHSKNRPYDLCCKRKKELLYVEVKGTQTNGEEVILTFGEVEFARRNKEQMAVFVVHSIKVSDKKKLTNGTERLIVPWDVDQGSLKPMSYKYKLP